VRTGSVNAKMMCTGVGGDHRMSLSLVGCRARGRCQREGCICAFWCVCIRAWKCRGTAGCTRPRQISTWSLTDKMLSQSLLVVAACVAQLVECAPAKLQERRGSAGVPDYVLKYGEYIANTTATKQLKNEDIQSFQTLQRSHLR
jgi:hypothetical protein